MILLKRILKVSLLSAIILSFIFTGIFIGIVIAYWNDLPSLEPLEYHETKSWHYPTKVYSDIARFSAEMSLKNLLKRLERLNYRNVQGDLTRTGQFSLKNSTDSADNEMKLYLRELNYPRFREPERLISIQIRNGKIAEIQNMSGKRLDEFFLEPEVIAEFYGTEGTDRELVNLSEIPETLVHAFIAIEDKRFYKHFGFDLYRIVGAFYRNVRYNTIQGASTITQQLARDLFLTRQQLYTRKIKEALLAIKIERRYTKNEILERYFNRINLGHYGSREVYGVEQAARYYFGKSVWNLNLQESATLATIPRDPPKYSPIRHPDNVRRRRQLVLKQMLKAGFITQSEHDEAAASPLETVSIRDQASDKYTAHFVEYIRGQLGEKYAASAIQQGGLKVYTTLDMSMQLAANSAVEKGLLTIEEGRYSPYDENKVKWLSGERGKNIRNPASYMQAALVSIETSTGYVRAMIGGRDFRFGQWNRAIQSRRSPGSAFKPFIYCAAFANNLATPTTIIVDEPWGVNVPGGVWEPKNFYEQFYGQVTVRKMLTHSINVATARLLYEKVGFDHVISISRAMGLQSPIDPVPSMALGTSGMSVMEMTSAYGVWANRGIRAEPICIKYVMSRDGNILEENTPPAQRVLDEKVAYLMTYLMQGVVSDGTGRRLTEVFGFGRPAAGKTGTTNDETDAWFMGFVPDLVTGVWVGFDEYGKSVGRTGAFAALPIWYDFMKSAVDGPVRDFPVPDGIVFKEVDADTGLPVTGRSANSIREAFIKGTEPTSY